MSASPIWLPERLQVLLLASPFVRPSVRLPLGGPAGRLMGGTQTTAAGPERDSCGGFVAVLIAPQARRGVIKSGRLTCDQLAANSEPSARR